jgi:ribose 5-phosphate isomerase B
MADPGSVGLLTCGSGIGISIAANRHHGIRAALCHCSLEAELSRRHNDANVLVMGGRLVGEALAIDMLEKFISTDFEGGRHSKRIDKIEIIREGQQ